MKKFCFAVALVGALGGCSDSDDSTGGPSRAGAGGNVSPTGSSGTQTGTGTGTGTGAGDESVGGEAGSTTTSAGVGGALSGGAAGMSVASDGGGGANDAGGGSADGGGVVGGPDNSVKPSAGCMNPMTQALDQWVHYKLMIQNVQRDYAIRLPKTFDSKKPHRVLFTFPWGNGNAETTSPYYNQPNADGIFIGVSQDGKFFKYTADSADVEFFDAIVKEVESKFCVDENRLFASGMSSGSWFTNVIGCQRSNVLRAQGNISGCWPDGRIDPAICSKQSIAGIFVHGSSDTTNRIECGMVARDRLLKLNGCSTETKPVAPSPCVEYQGCKTGYPVVWCQTKAAHDRQDGLTVPAIYNFFAKF